MVPPQNRCSCGLDGDASRVCVVAEAWEQESHEPLVVQGRTGEHSSYLEVSGIATCEACRLVVE